ICKACHQNKWDLVQEGSHRGGSAPFEDYCVTCHDPHHPDYFWNLTKQDWIPRDAPKSEISKLCYQCHTFSPEDIAQISDYHSLSMIEEPAPPLLPPLNLSLVLVLEIIIIAATIILSKIQSGRQKTKVED
ncbi:MAG: cytochrome c3 family protein, partial [Candidatus Bathyarchaeia archaeon]